MVDRTSPYADTPVIDFYLGFYVDRAIPEDDDDILIEIESRHRHRPDMLSQELYGTPNYWWVFMRRNLGKIQDPIYDFEPGLEIFVPTSDRLQQLLG